MLTRINLDFWLLTMATTTTLLIVGKTVTPVISMVGEGPITSESLAEDTKKVLEEITRWYYVKLRSFLCRLDINQRYGDQNVYIIKFF